MLINVSKKKQNNFVTETRTEGRHESWLALKQACSMNDRKVTLLSLLQITGSLTIAKNNKYVYLCLKNR